MQHLNASLHASGLGTLTSHTSVSTNMHEMANQLTCTRLLQPHAYRYRCLLACLHVASSSGGSRQRLIHVLRARHEVLLSFRQAAPQD